MRQVLLDIMLGDSFYRQLKYTERGFPEIIDGKAVEVYDTSNIKAFVEEKLPSLKGRDWKAIPSTQRV